MRQALRTRVGRTIVGHQELCPRRHWLQTKEDFSMGWQDRSYYRDRRYGSGNPLMWLLNGSVSLGRWFGINVRVHASLIVVVAIWMLLPGTIAGVKNAATASTLLFSIVLLHEFGHCFASRMVGGNPSEIIMTPLGGL